MVLAQLRSSVSTLAIRFYWERQLVVRNPGALLLQFLPLSVTYIRRLTNAELQQQGVRSVADVAWFGCFAYHTYTQLARSTSYDYLRTFMRLHDYDVLEVSET